MELTNPKNDVENAKDGDADDTECDGRGVAAATSPELALACFGMGLRLTVEGVLT